MSGTIEWDPGDALVFTQVVEEGSFTSAARALRMPKSTVSRRVSRLESHLGVQLLRRTTRRLSLTDAGQAFFAEASRGAEAFLAAEQAVSTNADQLRGRLRVTAPPELGNRNFEILMDFARANPEVHLELNLSSRYIDLVEHGFDVALRGGKPPRGSLAGKRIVNDELILVASPEYLEQHGTPTRARQISDHECILFPNLIQGSAWRLNGPKGAVRIPIQGQLTINHLGGIRLAALQGRGLALLPSGHCQADLHAGTLLRVLPRLSQETGGLWLVYPRTPFMPAKVRAFVDFVQAAYA